MKLPNVTDDWPYLVPKPGRGEVRACPLCGNVVVFSCYHDGFSHSSAIMNAARAARLRRTSGLYSPSLFVCDECGYEGPMEAGMSIGSGTWCAACSGRTPRQVEEARRKVRVNA